MPDRYLDERLVDVLQELPQTLAVALRPNVDLDAVMQAPAQTTPFQGGGELRVNDLLDAIMGMAQQQTPIQPEANTPSPNYPLVPSPTTTLPNISSEGIARDVSASLSSQLDRLVIQVGGGAGRGDGGDCCYLLEQLVAVAQSISQQLGVCCSQGQTALALPESRQLTNITTTDYPEAELAGADDCCHLIGQLVVITSAILQKLDVCCTGGNALPKEEKEEKEEKKDQTWGDWFKQKWENIKTIGKGFADPNELRGAGTSVGGAGALIGLPGVGKFGEQLIKGVDNLRQWNEMLRENNFRFAEYSGNMAQVQAESEARRIQMNMERGDRRAPWAQEQARIADKWADSLAKVEDAGANIRAMISKGIDMAFGDVIEAVGDLAEKFTDYTNKLIEFQEMDALDAGEWERDLTVIQARKARDGRPPHLANNDNAVGFVRGFRKGLLGF